MLMATHYIGCVMHLPTIDKIDTDQRHGRLRCSCCSVTAKSVNYATAFQQTTVPTINTAGMWVVFVTKPGYMLCPD